MKWETEENKKVLLFIMNTMKESIESKDISKDSFNEEIYLNILRIKNYLANNYPRDSVSTFHILLYNIFISYRRILKKRIDVSTIIRKNTEDINYLTRNLKTKLSEFLIEGNENICQANSHDLNLQDKNIFIVKENGNKKLQSMKYNRKRTNYPKSITRVLKSWLSKNLDHPYPDEVEKKYLILKTGLGNTQISNWFINARRRILPKLFQKQNNVSNL